MFFKKKAGRLEPEFWLISCLLVFFLITCARKENREQDLYWPQEENQEENKSVSLPLPRITDDIYVDVTARAALIFDKYKEDLDEAHRQMDLVYQKYGITFSDYDRYRRNLTADQKRRLENLVQEQIQKIYKEYFGDYE